MTVRDPTPVSPRAQRGGILLLALLLWLGCYVAVFIYPGGDVPFRLTPSPLPGFPRLFVLQPRGDNRAGAMGSGEMHKAEQT